LPSIKHRREHSAEIDLEIVKLQTELLSEKDLQKITEQIRKSIREVTLLSMVLLIT
jgi:hypothetical protein